jgi:UDP-glucose 4-epimerase
MMSLSESVDLVLHAFENGNSGDLYVRKSPAANVETLIGALGLLLNKKPDIQVIGIRHGEKMHEVLVGAEENIRTEDEKNYFRIPLDVRNLDYQIYFEKGQQEKNTKSSLAQRKSEKFNFKKEDSINDHDFTEVLWKGLKGDQAVVPAPKRAAFLKLKTGKDLDD